MWKYSHQVCRRPVIGSIRASLSSTNNHDIMTLDHPCRVHVGIVVRFWRIFVDTVEHGSREYHSDVSHQRDCRAFGSDDELLWVSPSKPPASVVLYISLLD
jgi:hypothetical protein